MGLVVLLNLSSEPRRKRTIEASQESLLVSFIEQLREVSPTPAIYPSNTPALKPPPITPPAVLLPEELESSTAPALIPPIDARKELERAARSAVARHVEKDSSPRFDVPPTGVGPPPKQTSHELGETERLEGGEVITWINDHCYYSNEPPPGPDLGAVRLHLPHCLRNRKNKRWYQDFEAWRKSKSELPAKDAP